MQIGMNVQSKIDTFVCTVDSCPAFFTDTQCLGSPCVGGHLHAPSSILTWSATAHAGLVLCSDMLYVTWYIAWYIPCVRRGIQPGMQHCK